MIRIKARLRHSDSQYRSGLVLVDKASVKLCRQEKNKTSGQKFQIKTHVLVVSLGEKYDVKVKELGKYFKDKVKTLRIKSEFKTEVKTLRVK